MTKLFLKKPHEKLAPAKALQFIFNKDISFMDATKKQYYAAFEVLEKDPAYFDLLELNSDDTRLLEERNAMTAYCHYVLTQIPVSHFRFKLMVQLLNNHIAPQLKLPEKIAKGEIVELPAKNFLVPIVDIFDYLKKKNKNIPKEWILSSSSKVIFLSDYRPTIFQNKKVVFHDVNTISELFSGVSGTNYNDLTRLIAYRPETIFLHETIVAASLRIQMQNNPDDLMKEVDKIMEYAKNDMDVIIQELYTIRQTLESKISAEIKGTKPFDFQNEIALSQTKIKNNDFGRYVEGFSKNDAIILLTLDPLFTKIAEEKISQVIHKKIDELIALKQLTQMPNPSARTLFLLTGGQASGKSTYLASSQCEEKTKSHGGLKNFLKSSIDALRNKLLLHAEIKDFPQELFSAITQNQATYIVHYRIAKELEILIKKNQAPHVLFEQGFVVQDKIDLGLMNGGRVHIIIVAKDVELCIERAFIRGCETGRFSSVQSMLYAHKESTRQLPDRILECAGKSVYIEIMDNNNLQDQPYHVIVEIDCQEKTILIHDAELFQKYIQKIALDPKATSLTNLYDKEKDASIEKYFEKIASQYKINYSNENLLRMKPF